MITERQKGMSDYRNRKIRVLAGIMGTMVLFVVLFSYFYPALEAAHDCCGDECQVCACIRECESTLRTLGDSAVAILFVILICVVSTQFFFSTAVYFVQTTPVTKKIRLNN